MRPGTCSDVGISFLFVGVATGVIKKPSTHIESLKNFLPVTPLGGEGRKAHLLNDQYATFRQ